MIFLVDLQVFGTLIKCFSKMQSEHDEELYPEFFVCCNAECLVFYFYFSPFL
jgi:hypothetical protein